MNAEPVRPVYCVWEITLACDLGCRHCGSRAGKARSEELDTREALRVVDELAALGILEVTLIGGEAYLREDWDQIAAAVVQKGMRCTMTTGARNLTQERVDRARQAGMSGFSISIDGLESTHDAQRGARGSWRAAHDAALRVAAAGMDLGVNTQINRLSMPELPALAALLVELGVHAWQLQMTVPMGRAADRPQLLLQPYDLLELFPLLGWIKATHLDPAGILLALGNNLGYHSPWEKLLRLGGSSVWRGCTAGLETLGLEANGAIKGCPSLSSHTWTGGYLGRDDLAEVVNHTPELRTLRERTREDLHGFCRTCEHGDTCLAGCSWTTDVYFQRSGDNPFCIHRALHLEARGLRERVERVQAAPGQPFDHGLFALHCEPMPPSESADSGLEFLLERYPLADVLALRPKDGGLSDEAWRRELLERREGE